MSKSAEANDAAENSDGPLLDLTDQSVKNMVKTAKKRGYVTHDELNAVLPSEEFSSEQIEDVLAELSEMGINVVDNDPDVDDDSAEAAAKPAKAAASSDDSDDDDEEEEESDSRAVAGASKTAVTGQNTPTSADRTDDPVRMYLREMGSVELLSREGEIAIAKRIEAGREMMIGGICESPLTIQAIVNWHDDLQDELILLREVIDLDATYGAGPTVVEEDGEESEDEEGENATGEGSADADAAPKADNVVKLTPPKPVIPKPVEDAGAKKPDGEEGEKTEGEEGEKADGESDDEDDGDEVSVSLAAMEMALRPIVLETFENIAKTHAKMQKVQEKRIAALSAGEEVPTATEKRYNKLKQELVELMEGVHLNNARIEQLVDHLQGLNRRLLNLEGK